MIAFYKTLLSLFLLLSTALLQAQVIEGKIVDLKTQESLPGATVYLDGTSIATITDAEGNFRLNIQNSSATLVVSFVGYLTYKVDHPSQYANRKLKIQLTEASIDLDEVVIGKGPFSRKQMLQVFRAEFLGESKAGRSCTIENEDDIVLYYNVTNNTLNASSRNPLRIQNKYLNYYVNFDLEDFKIEYNFKSLQKYNQVRSYFSGTTFYKELKESKNAAQRRKEIYYGSAQHFAYTLAHEAWDKEGITLFVNGFKVQPNAYFQVKDTLGIKKVTLIKEPQKSVPSVNVQQLKGSVSALADQSKTKWVKTIFNVLDKNNRQSAIEFIDKVIFVDASGNYAPVYGIIYGGYMGSLKAGDMLPIDYFLTTKEMQK